MVLCQRQKAELYAGCEAAGIGHVATLAGVAAIKLRQTVDEVVFGALKTEVHREVDHLQFVGQLLAVEEFLCIAVSGAEEEYINLVEGQLVGECKVGLAQKSAVHISDAVACITATVYKDYFYFGVVEQQTDKFAGSVSCATYDSYFYHIIRFVRRGDYCDIHARGLRLL